MIRYALLWKILALIFFIVFFIDNSRYQKSLSRKSNKWLECIRILYVDRIKKPKSIVWCQLAQLNFKMKILGQKEGKERTILI